jgi:hypothetical protein
MCTRGDYLIHLCCDDAVTVKNGGSGKWQNKKKSVTYNKSLYRDWSAGVGSHVRDIVVSRVHSLLLRRGECGMLERTQETDELIDMVMSLCVHEYSLVRKKAQKTLTQVLKRFPLSGDRVILRALDVIGTSTSSKGAVNGAVYTINNTWGLRKISRHWKLLSKFVTAMLDARVVEDTKAQVRALALCFVCGVRACVHVCVCAWL